MAPYQSLRRWTDLNKNFDYFFLQVFVTYVTQYSCNLQVVFSSILFEMIPIINLIYDIIFKIIYFHAWTLVFNLEIFYDRIFQTDALSNPSKRENVFSSRLIIRPDVCGSDTFFLLLFLETNELH